MTEQFYRYELLRSDPPCIYLCPYNVLKRTAKGVWLDAGAPKFVLLSANKRWACPTIEEAKESFRRRKTREVEILSARLRTAQKALELANADEFRSLSSLSFF